MIKKLPFPPLTGGEPPSKFDRHYETRRAKRWRDVSAVFLSLGLLVFVLLAVDPMFSESRLRVMPMVLVGSLCTVFLALTVSFHLQYRSRD